MVLGKWRSLVLFGGRDYWSRAAEEHDEMAEQFVQDWALGVIKIKLSARVERGQFNRNATAVSGIVVAREYLLANEPKRTRSTIPSTYASRANYRITML